MKRKFSDRFPSLARALAVLAGVLLVTGGLVYLVDEALNGTGKTRLYPEAYRLGRAGGVCRAALAAGETVPAAQLIPDYHRLSQAERERAARLQAAP